MWRDILKAIPKLGTVSTMRSKLKPIPTKRDCNKELKEYSEKLENKKGYLFNLNNEGEKGHRAGKTDDKYMERIISIYNPIPENVACKALEHLNNTEIDSYIKYITIDDWSIGCRIDKKWKVHSFEDPDDWADAIILLIITHKERVRVRLSHRIILYREFEENFENGCIEAIDWR